MKFINLSTEGVRMPVVGLGTWRAQPEEVENAVLAALNAGYTHIDTAYNYNNEESIGISLQKWISSGKGKREDLFITTKLPNWGNRASDVEKYLKESLKKLQLDYVDLYLMHMPFSFNPNEQGTAPAVNQDGTFSLDVKANICETWKAMEKMVRNGLTKTIGLSNFNMDQVKKIYENAEIKPAVLQIELHAYMQQKELVKMCKEMNIAVTAYSPLGSPGANNHFKKKYDYMLEDFPDILGHPVIVDLADKYKKTPGQILLKHLISQDIIVIPKSGNPDRIKRNINLFDFDIEDGDLNLINAIDKGEKGRIFDFLFFKGVQKHPEYPFTNILETVKTQNQHEL